MIRARERPIEALDDPHATAATWTGWRLTLGNTLAVMILAAAVGRNDRHIEELSTKREFVCAMAVGEQTVVPNAVEAVRENVEQEATDELAGFQRHDCALSVLSIIFPTEANLPVRDREQPTVANRDTMRVARQISEDLARTCKRTFGVDHPLGLAQGAR